jgi:hypothetical protein
MLSLSDEQMDDVTRAAALLPPCQRDNFLRSVANRLPTFGYGGPSDYELHQAITFCLNCVGVAAGHALFPTQEKQHATLSHSLSRRRR